MSYGEEGAEEDEEELDGNNNNNNSVVVVDVLVGAMPWQPDRWRARELDGDKCLQLNLVARFGTDTAIHECMYVIKKN